MEPVYIVRMRGINHAEEMERVLSCAQETLGDRVMVIDDRIEGIYMLDGESGLKLAVALEEYLEARGADD